MQRGKNVVSLQCFLIVVRRYSKIILESLS